jgi:hypothetical protein
MRAELSRGNVRAELIRVDSRDLEAVSKKRGKKLEADTG